MPGMKGDELLELVRNKVDNVKTILLTGHIDNKIIRELEIKNTSVKIIHKPWSEKDLVELIKK
jgi:FixJ family two-component response regulator